MPFAVATLVATMFLGGCGDDGGAPRDAGAGDGRVVVDDAGTVRCTSPDVTGCVRNVFYTCVQDGEFLRAEPTDCSAEDKVCLVDFGCAVCAPRELSCDGNTVVECNEEGSGFTDIEECAVDEGFVCRDGQCRNLCDVAVEERSYVGCEFYAADLDNATTGRGSTGIAASTQQYAVVVSNPGQIDAEVVVERNDAAFGEEPEIVEVERALLVPGDLEVFALDRREVDGSSSNELCFPEEPDCPRGETCFCPEGDSPCSCRNEAVPGSGLNDGTHTAVTSRAYRIRSSLPVIAYQFNPLDNVGVFSNDASMLVPTSAIDREYTVVGWPQTISSIPGSGFSSDLRATLTIIGTRDNTNVRFEAGNIVGRIVGGGPIPELGPGDTHEMTIGPFDVINLETEGFNADFTGSYIEASAPVTVFSGSEASDAPRFSDYSNRLCCADHLEEQLFPDVALGSSFVIMKMPERAPALNAAYTDEGARVPEPPEPHFIRLVVPRNSQLTRIRTTLPAPDDELTLEPGENVILESTTSFEIATDMGRPIAVMQVLPSQEDVGIDFSEPGGDPAIIAVPPIEQWRQDYVFLTPDKYAFDFVTIAAARDAEVRLDGVNVRDIDGCSRSAADGIERAPQDPPPDRVVYGCQLSFPDVVGASPPRTVEDGRQDDGVHTVVANDPVGVVVYGFDSFVSYGYVAGLDLKPILR
jgi:hypothetical protein